MISQRAWGTYLAGICRVHLVKFCHNATPTCSRSILRRETKLASTARPRCIEVQCKINNGCKMTVSRKIILKLPEKALFVPNLLEKLSRNSTCCPKRYSIQSECHGCAPHRLFALSPSPSPRQRTSNTYIDIYCCKMWNTAVKCGLW